ncbi:MAG: DUF1993 domain-containing protein [Pseudomonadota bacterium]
MSLTTLLVPTYRNLLQALSAWLDKAQQQVTAADAEALLSARLAPDMFPLSSQIRFACLQAREAAHRLRGEPLAEALDQLAREGQNAGDRPGTIAEAQSRIGEALESLDALKPDALDDGAQRPITLELPGGMIFDMTGDAYARDWALAQFYFHVVTAYAILRGQGIELGKADYVAHMFAYLRPGTMPAA